MFKNATKESDDSMEEAESENQERRNELSFRNRKRPARYLGSDLDTEESNTDTTSSSESDDDSDPEIAKQSRCGKCKKKKGPQQKGKRKDEWIGCDKCDLWYHIECEGASKDDQNSSVYYCKSCQNC